MIVTRCGSAQNLGTKGFDEEKKLIDKLGMKKIQANLRKGEHVMS